MTRHLVTGGAGLIGSHLVGQLLTDPSNRVVVLDDLSTGRLKNLLIGHFRLTVIEQSVVEPIPGSYDYIWHLACPASPPAYQRDPIGTINTCFRGTENVLKLAKRHNCPVLLASTSEIYGDPLQHPQAESYLGNVNTLGPRACYDEGKRIAETLAANYFIEHGTHVRIARIFNTYGPRMSPTDGRVISNFICQSLKDEHHTIYGDGSSTRSFCYVNDTVKALLKIMDSKGSIVYNVGNPAEITILELSKLIASKVGVKQKITTLDRPQDDPVKRRPDITKIQTDLDWRPTIDLSEGLSYTIAYFNNAL